MSILKALWEGELAPFERPVDPMSRYARCMARMMEKEDEFKALLDEETRQAFEKYCDYQYDLASAGEEDGFFEGFRLGARLMIDVMCEK